MEYKKINLEDKTLSNKYYRKVIATTKNMQLVLMSLKKNDFIKLENHKNTTQLIRVEKGTIKIKLGNKNPKTLNDLKSYKLQNGDSIIIPPNTYHYVENTGSNTAKLYTIYSPPEHHKNTKQLNNPDL